MGEDYACIHIWIEQRAHITNERSCPKLIPVCHPHIVHEHNQLKRVWEYIKTATC
jgi:hypothetical protein